MVSKISRYHLLKHKSNFLANLSCLDLKSRAVQTNPLTSKYAQTSKEISTQTQVPGCYISCKDDKIIIANEHYESSLERQMRLVEAVRNFFRMIYRHCFYLLKSSLFRHPKYKSCSEGIWPKSKPSLKCLLCLEDRLVPSRMRPQQWLPQLRKASMISRGFMLN